MTKTHGADSGKQQDTAASPKPETKQAVTTGQADQPASPDAHLQDPALTTVADGQNNISGDPPQAQLTPQQLEEHGLRDQHDTPQPNAEEQRGHAEEKVERSLTLGDRIDRIEHALGAGLGLNVRNHTDLNIRIERDAIVAEATAQAADLVRDAILEASEPLTNKQRIDRIETALRSGTPLAHLL